MKLISNDGQEFEIDEDTAKQSTLLKQFSDGECLNLFSTIEFNDFVLI
jgi:hypothetical protein